MILTEHWILAALLLVVNYPFVWFVQHLSNKPGATKTFDIQVSDKQTQREKRNASITTPVHALLFVAFLASNWLQPGSETLATFLVTFLITFLWTELWHYTSHIAMHTRPLHFIHREHHRSRITQPWTSVSFSFLEKFIFSAGIIGFLALLSHFIEISVYGIFAYYLLYFYTNTLGHANYEFRQAGYYERFWGKIFNSPSYHALHHARYTKNYGLMTPWLDKLFGTAWKDFSEVQTRAASSKPLTQLREGL